MTDNFVFSPFGVTLSLLKLYHGLDQHVTAQLADALHLTGFDDYDVADDVIDEMNDIVGSLAKLDDSNDLWLNSQLFYDKSFESSNFASDPTTSFILSITSSVTS